MKLRLFAYQLVFCIGMFSFLIMLSGCGDIGDDSSSPPAGGVLTDALIIDERSYDTTTTSPTARIYGYTWLSDTFLRDNCSATSPDIERITNVTITWKNLASGQEGKAQQFAGTYDDGQVLRDCIQIWIADNIDLQLGTNEIVLHTDWASGYYGDQNVIIHRIPVVPKKVTAVNKASSSDVLVTWEVMPEATSYNIRYCRFADPVACSRDVYRGMSTAQASYYVFNMNYRLDTHYYYTVRPVKDGVEIAEYPAVQSAVSTGDTAPFIVETAPRSGEISSLENTDVLIKFWEPIDCATVTEESVALHDSTGSPVSGTRICTGRDIIFTPAHMLAQQEIYTVLVSTSIRDNDGDPLLSPCEFSFKVWGVFAQLWSRSSLTGTTVKTMFSGDGNLYRLDAHIARYISSMEIDRALFVTKMDESGNTLWEFLYNTPDDETADDAAVDAFGNLFVVLTKKHIDLVTRYGTSLMKIAPNGALLWESPLENTWNKKLAVDQIGNVYLVSDSDVPEDRDVVLAKYDSQGSMEWRRQYGTEASDFNLKSVSDGKGNIYVASWTTGNWNLQIPKGWRMDKYNATGEHLWTKQLEESQYTFDMHIDDNDDLIIAYNLSGLHLAKYDPDGNALWRRSFNSVSGKSFVIGPDKSMYVAGASCGDLMVTRINAQGDSLWTYKWGTNGTDEGHAIRLKADGDLVVFGYSNLKAFYLWLPDADSY